ncbi:hypothetical protein [Thioclava sp. IC9]|uniref:hypothetical protein n=1 Tax=Thioclava sp. IC9 TaxID=1973007 RepID=UPI000B6D0C1A|nr:hypothetical protein [Thioclava sp. IC9]OWX97193.1 hypothetical protein B6V76_19365 [Thioclava sp. IC9]
MKNELKGETKSVSGWSVLSGAVVLAVLTGSMVVWANNTRPADRTHFTIHMLDYEFEPAHMVWHVGETVTVTLVNDSEAHPRKAHEWMVGRGPNLKDTVFGPRHVDGFHVPFFKDVDVKVVSGHDLVMFMGGAAHLSGVPVKDVLRKGPMGPMEEMSGFMPLLDASGQLTISFKVPDKPGQWTYGCFQQSGQHFVNGMRGTIDVINDKPKA